MTATITKQVQATIENPARPSQQSFDVDRLCLVVAGIVQRTLQAAEASTGDKPADPGQGKPTAAVSDKAAGE